MAKHTRSIHSMPPWTRASATSMTPATWSTSFRLACTSRNPDGTVASYDVRFSQYGMHLDSVFTRDEHVANMRIVDHSSLGPVAEYAVEPDTTGTILSFRWDASRLMTMLDAASWHPEKDVENALATIKQRVGALA